MSGWLSLPSSGVDDVREQVWNPDPSPPLGSEAYQAVVLEQYKLCVEMADRVSARRALANGFFLTLNSGGLAVVGALWQQTDIRAWPLAVPLAVLTVQAVAWIWMLRSYRQLNKAKYAVIGALEERLPASPYWRGEWHALRLVRDQRQYRRLTQIEQALPVSFIALYLALFGTLLVTRG